MAWVVRGIDPKNLRLGHRCNLPYSTTTLPRGWGKHRDAKKSTSGHSQSFRPPPKSTQIKLHARLLSGQSYRACWPQTSLTCVCRNCRAAAASVTTLTVEASPLSSCQRSPGPKRRKVGGGRNNTDDNKPTIAIVLYAFAASSHSSLEAAAWCLMSSRLSLGDTKCAGQTRRGNGGARLSMTNPWPRTNLHPWPTSRLPQLISNGVHEGQHAHTHLDTHNSSD